jgi:hypothetical protein
MQGGDEGGDEGVSLLVLVEGSRASVLTIGASVDHRR